MVHIPTFNLHDSKLNIVWFYACLHFCCSNPSLQVVVEDPCVYHISLSEIKAPESYCLVNLDITFLDCNLWIGILIPHCCAVPLCTMVFSALLSLISRNRRSVSHPLFWLDPTFPFNHCKRYFLQVTNSHGIKKLGQNPRKHPAHVLSYIPTTLKYQ